MQRSRIVVQRPEQSEHRIRGFDHSVCVRLILSMQTNIIAPQQVALLVIMRLCDYEPLDICDTQAGCSRELNKRGDVGFCYIAGLAIQ